MYIQVWSLENLTMCSLDGHNEMITCCSYDRGGDLLATASGDFTVKVIQSQLSQQCSASISVGYTSIQVWDVKDMDVGDYSCKWTLHHKGMLSTCGFSADGTKLLTTSNEFLKVI